jgi:hypothetical protein
MELAESLEQTEPVEPAGLLETTEPAERVEPAGPIEPTEPLETDAVEPVNE